jgi:uncharacterized protein
MRLATDGTLLLSPSDLSAHLACPHLTNLNLKVARGELERPHVDDTHGDLIRRKGDEHEAAYLERLEAEGRSIVRIPTYDDEGFDSGEARRLTEEAIRPASRGDHQPHLRMGAGEGSPTSSSEWRHVRAVDRKLARSAKPARPATLFYAEQVARIRARSSASTSRTGAARELRVASSGVPRRASGSRRAEAGRRSVALRH